MPFRVIAAVALVLVPPALCSSPIKILVFFLLDVCIDGGSWPIGVFGVFCTVSGLVCFILFVLGFGWSPGGGMGAGINAVGITLVPDDTTDAAMVGAAVLLAARPTE